MICIDNMYRLCYCLHSVLFCLKLKIMSKYLVCFNISKNLVKQSKIRRNKSDTHFALIYINFKFDFLTKYHLFL